MHEKNIKIDIEWGKKMNCYEMFYDEILKKIQHNSCFPLYKQENSFEIQKLQNDIKYSDI